MVVNLVNHSVLYFDLAFDLVDFLTNNISTHGYILTHVGL